MSTQVQRRKGTTAQHATFTGASAELTVDTTKNTVVVHNGATAGGIPLAKETGSAISVTSFASSGSATIETTDNTNAALRITQLGTGNALLVEDSANPDSSPFVIDTAGRVAIGHTSTVAGTGPSSSTRPSLQVHGLSNSTSGTGVYNWSSTASLTSAVTFNRSLSNTIGTFGGAVTSGTSLGALSFSGDDGVSFYEAARIQAQADATATVGSTPGRLTFSTTPTGTTAVVERLRIASNGDISIAGGTANGITYLNGSKVLTSGTALTFDGTNVANTGGVFISKAPGAGFYGQSDVGASTGFLGFNQYTGVTLSSQNTNPIKFEVNSAEQMRLTSTGLGIGTSSPAGKIHAVNTYTNTSDATIIAGGTIPGINLRTTAGARMSILSNYATADSTSFLTSTGGANPSSEVLRLDHSNGNVLVPTGNLGIGTTSPAHKLDVVSAGSITVRAQNTASTADATFSATNSLGSGLFGINATGQYMYGLGSFPLLFYTNGSERMRLDAVGRLSLGTTNVAVGGNAVRLTLFAPTPFSSVGGLGIRCGEDNTGGIIQVFSNSSDTKMGSITVASSGSGVAYNTSSDYRLKNITGPITTSGAYIDSLKPVEGTWKSSGATFVGLIAHETQEASRTTVATGTKDGDEMQGMDYSSAEIIANLIAEIQDLRKRLAAAGI